MFSIPKKGNAKECSNYHTVALISHASKVMLKILQPRLQQHVNWEFPYIQDGFRKGKGTRDQIANKSNGTPLQYSCLESPMDGGAWWAAIHGVAKSQTWLSDFTFTFHFHELEMEMATHSTVLAWRIPGTGKPGGLPSMGSHRVGHDWSDLAALHFGCLYPTNIDHRKCMIIENDRRKCNRIPESVDLE